MSFFLKVGKFVYEVTVKLTFEKFCQALRDSGLQALYVFISPPSLLSLEQVP